MGHPKKRSFSGFLLMLLLAFVPLKAQELAYPKIPPDRLAFIQGVLKEALSTKDSAKLAEAWYLYGKTFAGIGDYKTAQGYFFKSLRIQERMGESFELGRVYLRMGGIESIQGHFHEALGYTQKAKKVFEHVKSDRGLLSYYQEVTVIYESRWNEDSLANPLRFDSLLHMYKKVESLARRVGAKQGPLALALVNLSLGNLYLKKNPSLSIQYTNTALRQYEDHNETGAILALASQAPAYIHLAQYPRALQALTKASRLYGERNINDMDLQMSINRNYIQYFQAVHDWENAFLFLKKLNIQEKEKIIADRNGALARLALEYDTEKKEKQLRDQRHEITLRDVNLRTQQRFTWTLGALLVTAMVAGVVYFRLYRKNQKTSQWNGELLKEQNHRVKNNLQIISSLLNMQSKRLIDNAAKKAIEETRLRVESMAILHRKLYDGEKFGEINLIDFIPQIVEGVLKSYGYDHVRPEFRIADVTLAADKAVRLGLIVNELSTNACKYAFPFTNSPHLSVMCNTSKGKLELILSDNGPGIQTSVSEHSTKTTKVKKNTLGLSLIQAQVAQLNGIGEFSPGNSVDTTGAKFNLEFKL